MVCFIKNAGCKITQIQNTTFFNADFLKNFYLVVVKPI